MSPFGTVGIGTVILGTAAAAVLLAVVLTWPVCALLLHAYRRRIDRGMRSSVRPADAPPASPPSSPLASAEPARRPEPHPDAPSAPTTPRIRVSQVSTITGGALVLRARRRARRATLVFGIAGVLYAVAATAVYGVVDHRHWTLLPALAYTVLFAWPLVPTALVLSAARRRHGWLAYAGYVGLAVVLLWLAGAGPGEVVVVMVIPAVLIVALGARPLRGAAWLVAPGLTILGMALVALVVVAEYLVHGAPFTAYTWSFLAAGVGLVLLFLGYGAGVARLYAHKWASDQTLLILQWWLVATVWWTLLLATQGRGAAALSLAPYGVLLLVLGVTNLVQRRDHGPPARLLLLRTFGSRQRSSRLLYDLTRQWRWVGSVELITGTDLASEILEPDEFLDFLRGRTALRFVRDPASVPDRLAGLDLRPDRDGRYRVNELLCHEDTWQPTVAGLIGEVDAVLLDLRQLSDHHAGVARELELLVAVLPLSRVVALVDASTDSRALQQTLDRAVDRAPATAPLFGDPAPTLRVVVLSIAGTDEAGPVVAAVAHAAEAVADADGAAAHPVRR
jgi:hypothetical protein